MVELTEQPSLSELEETLMSEHAKVIPDQKNSVLSWIVCLTAALFFFYIFVQMLMFNAVGHDLMVDLHFGSTGLGTLSSAYFWGNVLFLFPAGLLLDRFSIKKIILATMALVVIGTFLFAYAHTFHAAILCRFLIGIGGAFALLTGLRLAARWYTPQRMALASGVIITMGFLGGLVSQTPLTLLVHTIGWRHALKWDALLGIFFMAMMFMLIKDFPLGHEKEIAKEHVMSLSFLWYSIKKAVANPQNWLFGTYTCLLNLPIFVFGAVFGVRYLQQIQHLSKADATYVTSMLLIGAMIGSPAIGWISDHVGLRKMPMIVCAIISLALILIIMYVPGLNLTALLILFLLLGFITSSQVISYPAIAESNPPEIVGTSLSIGSTLIMSGGAIFLPLFGWMLDFFWTGQKIHGVPVHTVGEYRFALLILPITFIIGIIAVMFAKETHCHFHIKD